MLNVPLNAEDDATDAASPEGVKAVETVGF